MALIRKFEWQPSIVLFGFETILASGPEPCYKEFRDFPS